MRLVHEVHAIGSEFWYLGNGYGTLVVPSRPVPQMSYVLNNKRGLNVNLTHQKLVTFRRKSENGRPRSPKKGASPILLGVSMAFLGGGP